ncbi:enkurin domain-containing protein 1-like [Symsagittifera roscoffensis]|uniref:enkurin domain-containing protein 1-like n=1 Tax=Symsagittifera roscoffensis TaxID=84072 RepID=UPI00307C64EF
MTSLLSSCPYPPDDYHERVGHGSKTLRPDYYVQPKIRGAGAKIHQMHKGSVGLMFGLDKHQIATGFKSHTNKNHMAMNVNKMRELQKKNKEASTQREQSQSYREPIRPMTTNPKYGSIQSKVKQNLESSVAPEKKNINFLRGHSRPASAPVKKAASESDLSLDLQERPNFVQMNAQHLSSLNKTNPKSYQALVSKREKEEQREQSIQQRKGKVPKYLAERKQQWQKEHEMELACQPDPEMPPGHRKMSEAERQKTLRELQESRKELLAELQRLPIAIRSQKAIQRKQEIESKLASAEEAIQIFARPKVFVKIDQ